MQTRQSKNMYLIIWEYQVKQEHLPAFKKIYANNGIWANLFNKSEGYLGTELLDKEADTHRFITIDRWVSAEAYEKFILDFQEEYKQLDIQCEGMTEQETLLGKFKQID